MKKTDTESQAKEAAAIFKKMEVLASRWEDEGHGSAFFELVTKDGGKIRMATKSSKRKV
jgi:hypothetical protein